MVSLTVEKHHAVCIPYPAQGHIKPMLQLAKLFHGHDLHITFVLTAYNCKRLVRSNGPGAVKGLADFRFIVIPYGLPLSNDDATQDIAALSESTTKNFLDPFCCLITKLNDRSPPVSCIVSDGVLTFTLDAARKFGIPDVLFWTASACGYLAYINYRHLVDRGLIPLNKKTLTQSFSSKIYDIYKIEYGLHIGAADMSSGCLDTRVDWIPGLTDGISLKDFPSFIRTTDAIDIMLNFLLRETSRASMADAIIINTFEALEEGSTLDSLQNILPPIYTIGPLSVLAHRTVVNESPLAAITLSLWKEDNTCLNWLNSKVCCIRQLWKHNCDDKRTTNRVRVGAGEQLLQPFWMIRPVLVKGESTVLPPDFMED